MGEGNGMKEYRIMAYFSAVYVPRAYKRKTFKSLEEALDALPKAAAYYAGYKYLDKVQIESRAVTEWHDYKEV